MLVHDAFDGIYSLDQLLDEHTQIPIYASTMLRTQTLSWREELASGRQGRDRTAKVIRKLGLVESPTLRRCPVCVVEDRARYGCAHWRLFHQWPVVRHCVLHGDLLESRCAHCHMAFVRGDQARLADDVCPHCNSTLGAADPFNPPAGYWPLVRLLYLALTGQLPNISIIRRTIAALNIQPVHIGRGKCVTRADELARRTCRAWNVGTLSELASALGVNWIWFNEMERSAGLRECPPMIKFALVANSWDYQSGLEAANDEDSHYPWAA